MNKKFSYLIGFLSIFLLLWGCGSTQTAAEKEMFALALRKSLEEPYFRFEATHVYPMGFRPIYLSPYYDVEVSADTLKVYLPYYGRAYRAPMDPQEGGFNLPAPILPIDMVRVTVGATGLRISPLMI